MSKRPILASTLSKRGNCKVGNKHTWLKRGVPTPIPLRSAPLSKVFSSFFCPVTHDLMKDAVMTDDGQTYERSVSKRDRLIDRVQTQYRHGGHRLLSVFTVPSARQMYFSQQKMGCTMSSQVRTSDCHPRLFRRFLVRPFSHVTSLTGQLVSSE